MNPAGNEAKRLLSVNHTTKAIHHHHLIIIIATIGLNQVAEILKYYKPVKNKLFCVAKTIQTSIY